MVTRPAAPDRLIDVALRPGPVRYQELDPFPQPAGAEAVFFGRTRHDVHVEHGKLIRLSYEAYEPMAQTTLHELAELAIAKFDCLAVRIHHTTGEVPAGAASVFVQTVCGHRDLAFQSCRFLIDELKQRAPIWKREEWEDGSSWASGVTPDNASPGPELP